MRDLLADLDRFRARGASVGRAVVASVAGSAPRPPGAAMLATADAEIAGSVAGGCVESAVAEEIAKAIRSGAPHVVGYGLSDDTGMSVGLACGGSLEVLVEPSVREPLVALARGAEGGVLATVLGGDLAVGAALVVREDGTFGAALPAPGAASGDDLLAPIASDVRDAALAALRAETSAAAWFGLPGGGRARVFLEVVARARRLVLFGATHVAAALVPMAKLLGYHVIVADGRAAFLTRERFPAADELVRAWPEEAFARVGIDRATCVCVLSHDPKFDEPALRIALRSDAAYVGAIGSRGTQAARRRRLAESGYTEAEIARLRGPIGLDLGGRSPAETALAIVAEITALRHGPAGRAVFRA